MTYGELRVGDLLVGAAKGYAYVILRVARSTLAGEGYVTIDWLRIHESEEPILRDGEYHVTWPLPLDLSIIRGEEQVCAACS